MTELMHLGAYIIFNTPGRMKVSGKNPSLPQPEQITLCQRGVQGLLLNIEFLTSHRYWKINHILQAIRSQARNPIITSLPDIVNLNQISATENLTGIQSTELMNFLLWTSSQILRALLECPGDRPEFKFWPQIFLTRCDTWVNCSASLGIIFHLCKILLPVCKDGG
jgi:hypothetical protein